MKTIKTLLEGVLIIEPDIFRDARGFFLESFQKKYYEQIGIKAEFVQDNYSRSSHGVLRGLHFQINKPQGKLVRVSCGTVLDVVVDVDPNSKTFGQHVAVELNEEKQKQLWIPPGYAHGFIVLSETADFQYKCTDYYDASDEGSIIWNDPDVAIDWQIRNPILSEKDQKNPTLKAYCETLKK